MTTASTSSELFERVEEFLGSEASKNDVDNAIKVLKEKGFNFGDNINDFWPDNMLDLIIKM